MVDNIAGIGGVGDASPLGKAKNANRILVRPRATDAVELSSDVMRLKGIDRVRLDKVMDIKKAVAAGTYLTADKLDRALDGAIDVALGGEAPAR